MIYKVYYQATKANNPRREKTKSLYIEADSVVEARALIEEHTPYNIELVQALEGNHLAYEQEQEDYRLTEFS